MKSERSDRSDRIDQFWQWFVSISATLADDVENRSMLKELDDQVKALNTKVSWEIGPGREKAWSLVVSPNLDRELWETTRKITERAPSLDGWEFHSARPPKVWDFRFELERGPSMPPVQISAASWTFVLLRHPDGAHEVLLAGEKLPPLSSDDRWQAAAITLESILGEDVVMDRIDDFELVDQLEPRFAKSARPIAALRDAVLGAGGN